MAKSNTPKIRFKGFTDDWEQRKLGDVLRYEQPQSYIVKKTEYNDKYDIPVLTAGQSFILGYTDELFGVKEASETNPVIIFDDFTTSSHYVDFSFKVKSSAMKLLALNYLEDNIYCVFNVLQNIKYVPVNHERHWISTFAKFDILLPKSSDEKKQVGQFFYKLDNLITLHQRKLEKLKNIKKSCLEKMFPKNGEVVPEVRFKGFTDDWEQRKLDEFVSFFSGLTYSPADIRPAGTLVLRSSNVKDGEVVDADNVYVDPAVVNSENVQDGDIIVVVRNGSRALIGKHAEIKGFRPNTVIGAFMTGIRSEHPSFLNALLNTPHFDKEVEMNMGATINQITGYMFSKMEFMVPSPDEQDAIGEYFKKLDNLITLHQRKLEKLKNIKKSCLEKMFV